MSDLRPDIWRLQAQSDVDGLIKALSNDDSEIRRRAAAALRALGATRAIPTLTAVLATEPNTEARSHILAALDALTVEQEREDDTKGKPPQHSHIAELLAALGSKQQDEVIAAVRALGDLKDKLAVVPLVMLFNNAATPIKVKLTIAETLLTLESAPVEVSLLGALRSQNWQTRRNGAAILGQLKAEWAIEPLAKALSDENEQVRRTAHAALKYIGTPEAHKALAAPRKPPQPTTPTSPPPAPAKPTVEKKTLANALENALGGKPAPPKETPPATQFKPPATPPLPTTAPKVEPPADKDTKTAATTASESGAEKPPTKLSWPKSKPAITPSLAPTRPLDPRTVEQAKQRMKKADASSGEDDNGAG